MLKSNFQVRQHRLRSADVQFEKTLRKSSSKFKSEKMCESKHWCIDDSEKENCQTWKLENQNNQESKSFQLKHSFWPKLTPNWAKLKIAKKFSFRCDQNCLFWNLQFVICLQHGVVDFKTSLCSQIWSSPLLWSTEPSFTFFRLSFVNHHEN